MYKKYFFGLLLIVFILNYSFAGEREIAITIDDLPLVGASNNTPGNLKRSQERFAKILQTLIDHQIPAVGFVIAGTISKNQWEWLEQFREAGFKLGNHTYTHRSLNQLSAEKYIEDVDRADRVLTPIMTTPKYFRYPYLAEGAGEKKQRVYDYLAVHQYTIAPVTVDSKDYLFNEQLYRIPYRLREQQLNSIRQRYLAYIWNQTLKAENKIEKLGDKQSGKQILLIHANLLNSYLLGDVIDLYKKNGYKFISLDDALSNKEESVAAMNMPVDDAYNVIFKGSAVKSLFNYKI